MININSKSGTQPIDEEIISRVINGEKDKYEMLMRKYNQHLFRIGRTYLKNIDDIEDVMQETFVKAYIHLKSFNNKSAFSTWLTRILINEALIYLKKNDKKITESINFDDEDNNKIDLPFEMKTNKSPESILLNKELRNNLEEIIDSLPAKYKTIYVMREIEGMDLAEISKCLETNLNTIKIRLLRARKFIKEKLLSIYKSVPIYDLHETHCTKIINHVMERINMIHL